MRMGRALGLCTAALARQDSTAAAAGNTLALITDFDSTLTMTDTLHQLISLAPNPALLEQAEKFYIQETDAVHDMVCNGNVHGALQLLQKIENQALDMVEASNLLKGIKTSDIEEKAANLVRLRPRAFETLRSSGQCGIAVHICSINWSRKWIECAVGCASAGVCSVVCNDLVTDDTGVCTGELRRRVMGARDKEEFVLQVSRTCSGGCIYVGDALPDVLALQRADVGVVIGANPTLRAALVALKMKMLPLEGQCLSRVCPGTVYLAESWEQIAHFLQGP